MVSSSRPAHFCNQYVQPMWSEWMQTTRVYVLRARDFLRVEKNTLCPKIPASEESNEMTRLHCKTSLGGKVELCSLCTKCQQHSCFLNGILIQDTWLLIFFFLPSIIFCVSSLLSCFLANYSNLQYLHEFATHLLPTHNSIRDFEHFQRTVKLLASRPFRELDG